MKLVDIMPLDDWIEIEQEINRRSGLNAAVYDTDGLRITKFIKWANNFCPELRATGKGQKYICAVAHQNIASRAVQTGKTVVAECDAGLMKFVVPIFVGDEFLGTAGGCGLRYEQGEVDAYLVHRTSDMDEQHVRELGEEIGKIDPETLTDVIGFVEDKVFEGVSHYTRLKEIA